MLRERTVVLSVIFNTSFPSEDFHFTQYLVYLDTVSFSRKKRRAQRTLLGDFAYKASAASWYSCQDAIYTMIVWLHGRVVSAPKNSITLWVTNM
jgi:hypothetical protein